jgi:hypothetical protein
MNMAIPIRRIRTVVPPFGSPLSRAAGEGPGEGETIPITVQIPLLTNPLQSRFEPINSCLLS